MARAASVTGGATSTVNHNVYIIGRDPAADVTLPSETVSRFHAELIVAQDGLLFYSDRSSSGGSYVYVEGQWHEIRAYEVLASDRIRLGQYETEVSGLLQSVSAQVPRPQGNKVRRDPNTGEVIRG
ncbi:MAG: FHA domain-containing protein [Pseudomonadales bacterium]